MSQHPTTSLVCLLSFFLSISFASSSSLSTDDTQAQSLIVPTIERIGGSSQSRNGAENFAKLPQIKVTSVFNETLGSRVHTSGCWEFPAFFTAEKHKYPVNPKPQFTIDCWTRPVLSFSTLNTGRFLLFDNDIIWFHNQKENCWLPDYMVQPNAVYGTALLQLAGPLGWIVSAAASSAPKGAPAPKGNGAPQNKGQPQQAQGKGQPPSPQLANPWRTEGAGPKPTAQPTGWGTAPGASPPPSSAPPPWATQPQQQQQGVPKGAPLESDLRYQVRYCPTPHYQVGSFRDIYKGETYCYKSTRLDAENHKIKYTGVGNIWLDCHISGTKIEEDETWWKIKGDDCYVPNQVFDPSLFQGNAGRCAK